MNKCALGSLVSCIEPSTVNEYHPTTRRRNEAALRTVTVDFAVKKDFLICIAGEKRFTWPLSHKDIKREIFFCLQRKRNYDDFDPGDQDQRISR